MRAVVFTGDLIGSTAAPSEALEASISALAQFAERLSLWQNAPARFTRSRGDGWQMIVTEPKLALRALAGVFLTLNADKTLLKTRIGLGFGAAELPSPHLSDARGTSFERAGQALDQLKAKQILGAEGCDPSAKAALILLSSWAHGVTAAQAEAAALALDLTQPTLREMAARIGVSEPSVHERLTSADFDSVQAAFLAYESE